MSFIDHNLKWGSSGIDGTEPLKWSRLGDLDSTHLNNILLCCGFKLDIRYRATIYDILQSRGVKPFTDVADDESKRIYDGHITRACVIMRNRSNVISNAAYKIKNTNVNDP
jgi:hypothetical protein